MSGLMIIQNQLLATKFFLPITSHPLVARPRLRALLKQSLDYPLTLVSAPAGFGKTMGLSAWGQSLSSSEVLAAWLTLDEEDNEPQGFWINVLTALSLHQPERFTPLLKYLQAPQPPPLNAVLETLVNLLTERTECFVLILDDYHLINEPQVHTTLAYLIERLPTQLRIVLATRTDPPLPLTSFQARGQLLQVRTDQLCCTEEETKNFLSEVMHIQLPDATIGEITKRTEGWLVGLQLLGLSLPGCSNPATLLAELSGDQCYILDFLTDEVLKQQSQEVQKFLLSTCILEQLTASLCDAVMEQTDSQRLLEQLEQANLFIISLDGKHQWYRYHALFAEALRYRLKQMGNGLVLALHWRASFWYAQHNQATQAILHAFHAKEWQWAGDLIERLPVTSLAWGAGEHEQVLLRQWLEQLPADMVHSRPRLCLTCAQMLWTVVPPTMPQAWLNQAEKNIATLLAKNVQDQASSSLYIPQTQQEQENLLGEIYAWRALIQSFEQDGATILGLCQKSFALLAEENNLVRAYLAFPQFVVYYASMNNAMAAIESALSGGTRAQEAGYTALAICLIGSAVIPMIAIGQLQSARQLTQQAIRLGREPEGFIIPEIGWPMMWQAALLCEWDQLDAAYTLAQEAIALCGQSASTPKHMHLLSGYAILARICLACGKLEEAHAAFQYIEQIGQRMSQPFYRHTHSFTATVDQARLWLACGEQERAVQWLEGRDLVFGHVTPFTYERQEVACARILLAAAQPAIALQRLKPVLENALLGHRWYHVIEMRILQALAYQMCHEQQQALCMLLEAVNLAESECYVRTFVNEGDALAALLLQLQKQEREAGPTPYLDMLLTAFPQQSKSRKRPAKCVKRRAEAAAKP